VLPVEFDVFVFNVRLQRLDTHYLIRCLLNFLNRKINPASGTFLGQLCFEEILKLVGFTAESLILFSE
jgi:hypothetical protein